MRRLRARDEPTLRSAPGRTNARRQIGEKGGESKAPVLRRLQPVGHFISLGPAQCRDRWRDLAAAAMERVLVVPLGTLLVGGVLRHHMLPMPYGIELSHSGLL